MGSPRGQRDARACGIVHRPQAKCPLMHHVIYLTRREAQRSSVALVLAWMWQEALSTHPIVTERRAPNERGSADITRRTSLLAIRGTDLLAVVDNELRMTSVAYAKRHVEQEEGALSFKVLANEVLDFTIQSIHVNPTGKLLVVVGVYEVVIVILPRRGYMKQVGKALPVKAVRIGTYYHAPHGTSPIAQCKWHPYGAGGVSLIVLTEDAVVREYDISHDVDEPQQTLAVLGQPTRTSTMLSAEDDDARVAVSCTFGEESSSWLLFTLLVLMRSGDVYLLCPFMPKRAALPRMHVEALAALEARKTPNTTLAARYLSDLVRQMQEETVPSLDDTSLDPMEQVTEGFVPVMLPACVPHRTASQGPCLLRPAPVELNEDVASVACDLTMTRITEGQAALDVVLLATLEGSIQCALLATPIKPQWIMGRNDRELPIMAVYECIDLELPRPQASTRMLQFVKDALYPDIVWVSHMHGMHVLSLQPWTAPLLSAMARGDTDSLAAEQQHTAVAPLVCLETSADAPAITGACIINDVYLSYAFFILTSDNQLLARELNLRSVAEAHRSPIGSVAEYQTLLAEPFVMPKALAPIQLRPPSVPGEIRVDAHTLRAFGQATEAVRQRLQDVAKAGHVIQARTAQQMREMQRQVTQLAQASKRVDAVRAEVLRERIERINQTQRATVQRLDTLLQQLMDEHTPQLSVYERRWFDELQRMSHEFLGNKANAKEQLLKLQHQWSHLQNQHYPQTNHVTPKSSELGSRQRERIEHTLAQEARMLAQARAMIQYLRTAMGMHM